MTHARRTFVRASFVRASRSRACVRAREGRRSHSPSVSSREDARGDGTREEGVGDAAAAITSNNRSSTREARAETTTRR